MQQDDLPTAADINVFDSLDEQWAVKRFLGKSLDDVEAMLRDGCGLSVTEDLSGVGPRAFCFYVEALVRYLKSEPAQGDADAVNGFCNLAEWRLRKEMEVKAAWPLLRDGVDYVVAHVEKFDLITDIDVDTPARLVALQSRLRSLCDTPLIEPEA